MQSWRFNENSTPGVFAYARPDSLTGFAAVLGLLLLVSSSCSRATYRQWADRDAYSLINSRQLDSNLTLPSRPVEPESISRLADAFNPDCPPQPPDDPIANDLLRHPYKYHNHSYWDKIGSVESVENYDWEVQLPTDDQGIVEMDRKLANEMALLHSREYQTAVESLYLNALGLSGNRFEFDTNWFFGTTSSYNGAGRNSAADRTISQNRNLGFRRNLAAGGQMVATLANSLMWQLTPSGPTRVSSNIAVTLTQPLLRGAYRHIRLESLSQAERNLLYEVRDFTHFRRQFYRDITGSYLGLLAQTQSLRNQRANLKSLELNLLEFQELYSQGAASQLQVDQVFQDYQSGRISILAQEQSYANTLDGFKFQMGLPPRVQIRINEDILKPFELSNPEFDKLKSDSDSIFQQLVQYLPPEEPPRELLDSVFEGYATAQTALKTLVPEVESELQKWFAKLDAVDVTKLPPEDKIDYEQQEILIGRIKTLLVELKSDIHTDVDKLDERRALIESQSAADAWKTLSHLLGRQFREQHSALFLMQNQIRLFLIEVTPFNIDEEGAVNMALANRLDLMNQRGITMDAWRGVEIAADALKSDLSVRADVGVGTDPNFRNPVRFDSSASSVALGLEFDGPLNRFNERNNFRAAQIGYQQSRRTYMAREDGVVNTIRSNLRRLRINALNFQISRQQLIAATRQVDETQTQLRTVTTGDSSLTRDLLQALQGLLAAKNNLISSWIDYEVARIEIFVELELLYLDQDGSWTNENFDPDLSEPLTTDQAQPEPLPAGESNDPASENGINNISGTDPAGDIGANRPSAPAIRPVAR